MRAWFKCLSETTDSMREIIKRFSYEGQGMAQALQEIFSDAYIASMDVQDLCNWLKIRRPKAEILLPYFEALRQEYYRNTVGLRRNTVGLLGNTEVLRRNTPVILASNAGPERNASIRGEEREEREREIINTPLPPAGGTAGKPPKRADYSVDFEIFWLEYPRGEGKAGAFKVFEKLRKSKELPSVDLLVTNVRRLKASQGWAKDGGQFIPWGERFLSGKRWEDTPLLRFDSQGASMRIALAEEREQGIVTL